MKPHAPHSPALIAHSSEYERRGVYIILLKSFRWVVSTNWFPYLLTRVLVGGSLLLSLYTGGGRAGALRDLSGKTCQCPRLCKSCYARGG